MGDTLALRPMTAPPRLTPATRPATQQKGAERLAQKPSTMQKIGDRLERSGHNILEGAGKTLEGAAKTAVAAPIILTTAAGDVLIVTVGAAVVTAQGVAAGVAGVAGVATGLAVDFVELLGKAVKAIGRNADSVGDASLEAARRLGKVADETTEVVVRVIKRNNKQIPKAFDKGYEAVSPKSK